MRKSELGQALLIILLVMAVGLTIGLSIISRSITDIKISQQEEESARAFSVAEAGIEKALIGAELSGTIGGIDYSVTLEPQGESLEFDFGGAKFEEGDIQTVWLVGHTDEGELDPDDVDQRYTGTKIRVFWGDEGTPSGQDNTPALEATLFYEDGGEFKTIKFTGDPNSGRRSVNEFSSAGSAGYDLNGKKFQFRKILNLPEGVVYYALRLKLIYNNDVPHPLGVRGVGDELPSQGTCYESTATVPESGITRKVQQCQFHKTPPGIFDYVLFSGGDLIK